MNLDTTLNFATESPSFVQQYPRVSEEAYQWKSKQKQRKGKLQDDEGKTDTSSMTTVDETHGASELTSGHTGVGYSHSSHSTISRRVQKHGRRTKKSNSQHSANTDWDRITINESSPEAGFEQGDYSPFATLSCPVCSDPSCILNVASTCPLVRYNEEQDVQCGLCDAHCECIKCKGKFLPVSGLVPRDENGVAESLLKKNGGPIENSSEWANRKRWIVPYGINWDHQVDQWVTSKMQDVSKTNIDGSSKKRSKSRLGKRKSKHGSPTRTLSQAVTNSDNVPQEDKLDEQKIILDGIGFKILSKGNEKVLINFDSKNCKYLGCCCKTDRTVASCGCNAWMEEGHGKRCSKKEPSSKRNKQKPKVSLVREVLEECSEVKTNNPEKVNTNNKDSLSENNERSANEFYDVKEGRKRLKDADGNHAREKSPEMLEDNKKNEMSDADKINTSIRGLSARDVRNLSRADVLEDHLRSTLGQSYKPEVEPLQVCPSGVNPMAYSLPGQGMAEVMMAPMEIMGPCMCAERYCYTSG